LAPSEGYASGNESYWLCPPLAGAISVYREEHCGTVFKICLPCATGSPAATEKGDPAQQIPPGNETIILAEDDKFVREMVLLYMSGYTDQAIAYQGVLEEGRFIYRNPLRWVGWREK
jgi:hypothetical protein